MDSDKLEVKRGEKMDEEKERKLRAYKLFIKAQQLQAAEKDNQGAIPKVLNFIPSMLEQGSLIIAGVFDSSAPKQSKHHDFTKLPQLRNLGVKDEKSVSALDIERLSAHQSGGGASSKEQKSGTNKEHRNISQSLAIIVDDPLRASADIMLPTPSSHGESKDSKEPKVKENK